MPPSRTAACGALLLAALLCLSNGLRSQTDISGYILTLPLYQERLNAPDFVPADLRRQFTSLTRLRLRSSTLIGSSAYLQAEAEAALEYASEKRHSLGGPVATNRQLVGLTTDPGTSGAFRSIALIDRLYLRWELGGVDITAGRQRISWGVGRIWTPTDLFNPLNPAVLGKIEKDGADALAGKLTFGSFSDLTLVVNGGRSPDVLNAGARFRKLVDDVAVSLMGGSFDDRWVAGGDVTFSVLDAGARLEGIISVPESAGSGTDTRISIVAGIDNQFTSRLYGLLEYFYNGAGSGDRSEYRVLRLLRGETTNLGRDIAAVRASYLLHPLVTAGVTVFRNLNDGSGMISGDVTIAATGNISIAAGMQYFAGSDFSEFWYYPSTAYARADWFF